MTTDQGNAATVKRDPLTDLSDRYTATLSCGHTQEVLGSCRAICHCWTCNERVYVLDQEPVA